MDNENRPEFGNAPECPKGFTPDYKVEAAHDERRYYRELWLTERAERDALAAHVEAINLAAVDLRNLMAAPGSSAEHYLSRVFDALESKPTTSLARLKAEWQAEALEEMAQRLRDDPAGHPLFKVEYWANKYRRQATGGER